MIIFTERNISINYQPFYKACFVFFECVLLGYVSSIGDKCKIRQSQALETLLEL